MKHILQLFLFFAIIVPAKASNFFEDGTQWLYEIGSCDSNNDHTTIRTLEIDGLDSVGDKEALCLFETIDEKRELVLHLFSEGDKVWFWHSDSQQWLLMYDFGLLPSEHTNIYNPMNSELRPYDITFLGGRLNIWGTVQPELIELSWTEPEYSPYYESDINWFDGIGNPSDMLDNTDEMVGRASKLISVTNIKAGMVYAQNPDISGIKTVDTHKAEQSQEHYLDLMGQPIAEPTRGNIYIRVDSRSARKFLKL